MRGARTRRVRELRFIRTGNFAFLATQSQSERKREKTKRAMLPSVSFVDDEVTSQQVLVLEVLYERALHRTSVSAASHLRQIYFRKDCERGGRGGGELWGDD